MELSVRAISGLITVAIALLQILLPNALTVVLVAQLFQEHNAVTWSGLSHSLPNSIWPILLRSDSTTSRGVPSKINLVAWNKLVVLALIAVAAVRSPIGLYKDLVLSDDTELVTYEEVVHTGSLGTGTPPRSDTGFSRACGGVTIMQCPGTTTVIDMTMDGDWINSTVETDMPYGPRIPKVLAELYQNDLRDYPPSVSSYFGVQARQYQFRNEQGEEANASYLVDLFRPVSSLVMDESVVLVDGLIVDLDQGAIGFRKHTFPPDYVTVLRGTKISFFLRQKPFVWT